jgi:chromosome segregation protein
MTLLESDDVLEAGIEVVAQPPGKRLQNILLLSGGEKAMTAIALVLRSSNIDLRRSVFWMRWMLRSMMRTSDAS